jgi:hypothetical protein
MQLLKVAWYIVKALFTLYFLVYDTSIMILALPCNRGFTLLSISSHRCSIGDKSGLYGGQSSGLMLWLARKSWHTLATWGRALSCWKIRWCCCTNGSATGRRISSLYLMHVKLPAITINGDFNPWDIPPQNITEPPQTYPPQERKRRRSVPHDVGIHTRRRPSGRKRVNRDSSVKKTRLHCIIGNCLGPYAANQAIRRARRARVRGKPM